ncbi:hypothetical protein D3C79_1074860 [compost metagenome]
MWLHRVVMLISGQVSGIYLQRCTGELRDKVATRCRCLGRCFMRLRAGTQVCLVGLFVILDSDQ